LMIFFLRCVVVVAKRKEMVVDERFFLCSGEEKFLGAERRLGGQGWLCT